MYFKSLLASLAAAQLVAGHGAIIKAVGDKGGSGTAIGIDTSIPRDGSSQKNALADTTIFKNKNADACGETIGGGPNDPVAGVAKVVQESNGLPKISAGGMVLMTLHQVNADGAGPYNCMIDSTGTGTGGWTKMQVVTNVPGKNSISNAQAENFPLSAKVAADQTCTGSIGGMNNVCMVRCNNSAGGGPFGGCVPVQMVGAGGASNAASKGNKAGNANAAAKDNKEGNANAAAQDNKERNANTATKDNKEGKANKAGNANAAAKDNKEGNANAAAQDNKEEKANRAGNANAACNKAR